MTTDDKRHGPNAWAVFWPVYFATFFGVLMAGIVLLRLAGGVRLAGL